MKSSSTLAKTPKTKALYPDIFPKDVVAFTNDRKVNFAFPEHSDSLSASQLESLEAHLGFSPKIVNIRQVHGNRIVVAHEGADVSEQADGLITNAKNIAIVVRTADCFPIFIFDPKKHAIGLVHAGWKGTHKHILSEAIKAMKREYGSQPSNLKLAFGPAIRACCYEVAENFLAEFPMETFERKNHCYLDMALANTNQALEAGVPEEQIFDCGICTFCDKNYFSYRREKEKAGRMLSLMLLRG